MYCIALSLKGSSNKECFEIAQKTIEKNNFSIIEKFHMTLMLTEEEPSEVLIQEIVAVINNHKANKVSCWKILDGQSTEFKYLTIELSESKLTNAIDILRKKYMKNSYFKMVPHISLVKTVQEMSMKDLVLKWGSHPPMKEISFQDIIVFDNNKDIIAKYPI